MISSYLLQSIEDDLEELQCDHLYSDAQEFQLASVFKNSPGLDHCKLFKKQAVHACGTTIWGKL